MLCVHGEIVHTQAITRSTRCRGEQYRRIIADYRL
jgi:hypothetical protein